jgi:hypothetical protein
MKKHRIRHRETGEDKGTGGNGKVFGMYAYY